MNVEFNFCFQLTKKELELQSLRDRLAAQEQQQKQLMRQFNEESQLQDEK